MGIAPESLNRPEDLLPLRQGCEFLEIIGRSEGIESVGLKVGARTSMCGLRLFGAYLCQALTLHDLIRRLIRYVGLAE